MSSFNTAVYRLGLGVALLTPCLDSQSLGPENGAGTRNLAGRIALIRRQRHFVIVVTRRRGRIDNIRLTEMEKRTGIDRDYHGSRIGELRIRRKVSSLPAINRNRDRAAVAPFAIKR